MRQYMAQGNRLLAVLRKFGDIQSDRIVQSTQTTFPQLCQRHGGNRFAGRKPVYQVLGRHDHTRPGFPQGRM